MKDAPAARIAVISGGMGAVGRATSRTLVEDGYVVVSLYHQATTGPERGVHPIRCDVRDSGAIARVMERIVSEFGRIDACIHAAADRIDRRRIAELDEAAFRAQLETSVFGAFNLFAHAHTAMRAQQAGILIGITSAVAEPGATGTGMGAYTVGKIALRGLLRELSRELKPEGIRVCAVAPGLMRTPLTADLPDRYFEFASTANGQPLTEPAQVADAVAELCRPGAIDTGISIALPSGSRHPL